jgi:inner membrane protein YidH
VSKTDKDKPPGAPVPEGRKAAEYLANERTFLAWIRTSIAVISLGFVVAKFGLWIGELEKRVTPQTVGVTKGVSVPTGLAMIAFGGALAVLAAWRFRAVNLSIERGEVRADRGLVLLITAVVALLSLVLIGYMLVSVERL